MYSVWRPNEFTLFNLYDFFGEYESVLLQLVWFSLTNVLTTFVLAVCKECHSVTSHLMVWLKELLRIWLLSLEKLRQVTPLLWACSNLRRHKPLWIFHTFHNNTHTDAYFNGGKMMMCYLKDELIATLNFIYSSVKSWVILSDRTFILPFWAPVASRSASLLKHMHSTASSIIMKLSWAWYFKS